MVGGWQGDRESCRQCAAYRQCASTAREFKVSFEARVVGARVVGLRLIIKSCHPSNVAWILLNVFKMFGGSDRARLNSHRQSDRQCRPRRVRQFITCPPCRWRILLHPGGFRSDQEPFRFALQSKLGGACQKRGVVPRCTCGCARGVPAEPGDEVRRGVGKLQCTTLKWSSTFGPSPFTL